MIRKKWFVHTSMQWCYIAASPGPRRPAAQADEAKGKLERDERSCQQGLDKRLMRRDRHINTTFSL